MAYQENINDEFLALEEETMQVAEQVQAYQRKLMAPIWEKRRTIAKSIPGFWGQTIGNSPLFAMDPHENDIEALENLIDFHVEFDDNKPNYRKITATFKKNDVFKNETLTKEFSIDPEDQGTVISKSTIEYHENKKPNKKRKADDEDDFAISLIDWFGDDDVRTGIILSEDIFPSATEYYQGLDDDEDDESDDENEEIELGSDSEEEEEEEKPKKRSRK